MSNYLKLTFDEDSKSLKKNNYHEFRTTPFSNTDVTLTTIESFTLLTHGKDVKRVYDLKLCTKDVPHDFLPGDTIGILPRNNEKEVDELLVRLNLISQKLMAYKINILENTTKKNPIVPKHIPKQGVLKDIFMYYIDIRKPPKKLFLKALIPFTTCSEEVNILEKICSPSGSKDYIELITGKSQTLLDLLNTFSSCNPPIEIILEHSLPLQPRYYSVSSSPMQYNTIRLTFFIVENDNGTKGVCTGWLEEIMKNNGEEKVPIYFRKPNNFRLPAELSVPLIMVATGTGIAPFMGFLEHRLLTKMNGNRDIGDAYLFYGCRYSDRDYLYHNELEEYLKKKVLTKVYTVFSRMSEQKWYVQDEINRNGEEFISNILYKKAVVYICGDTKTMLKGVREALVNNLTVHGHLDENDARAYLEELIKENRFVADCWT